MSAALATHWVANLAIGQLFLPALGRFGVSGVYLFFAGVCAVTIAFTSSQVVETKARAAPYPTLPNLQQIQKTVVETKAHATLYPLNPIPNYR